MSDSIFDGIENARASMEGNYVRPGEYNAVINAVKLTENFAKEKFLAVELKITKVIDNDEGRGHKLGEETTHLMKVANVSFLGNFKQFAASTLGVLPEEVGKAEADRITSDEQPLAGIEIALRARQIMTKKTKQPFTKVVYLGEVGQSAESN